MKLLKNTLISTLIISSVAMAQGDNFSRSSAALAELKSKAEMTETKSDSDKLFYLVDDFSQLKTVPGFTFGAPSGLVPGWGVGFAALSGVHKDSDTDGATAFGFGFGDPFESIGGAASLSIGSIDPSDGGAFNRGSFNLSLGHTFPEYEMGVAVGMSNFDIWHDSSEDELDESFYISATKLFPNDTAPMILTAGFGNESYVDINTDDDRDSKIDPFIAGAVYLHPQMSLVLDYTTGITTFGTSLVPFPDYPVTLGLALTDLFKEADEDAIGFIGSLAVGFTF
ncbi:hypothetical protein [uncultured Ilyobacter sp.]|uniref:hypothetical protein n=1 Tax=uncultured Ilyobacter sp. TaxID=544433 RepID=UPI0029BFD2A9|nr:hypothetical protein [uncultured Ilyobacter sp.]